MFPDFSRPPIPPNGPRRRWSRWLVTALIAIGLGALATLLGGFVLGILVAILAVVVDYSSDWFFGRTSPFFRQPESDFDTPDLPRVADREEVQAYRGWQQRRVTRYQYERVVARRRLAHREISREQFDALIAYIGDAEAGRPAKPGS